MSTKLSKNFTLQELTKSATADRYDIDNTPNEKEIENLKRLANNVLQPIRDKWKKSIFVNSGFRCEELNTKVGGSKTSQHRKGEAADIEVSNSNNAKLFNMIKGMIENNEIEVGQLIWEYGTKKNLIGFMYHCLCHIRRIKFYIFINRFHLFSLLI